LSRLIIAGSVPHDVLDAPQPLRVVSLCSAQWKGRSLTAQVEAGPDCFEV
jgi:hypothetical protein